MPRSIPRSRGTPDIDPWDASAIWPWLTTLLVPDVMQRKPALIELSAWTRPPSPFAQHDASHRPAGRALDAGEQLGLAGAPTAAVMAHPGEDLAQRPIAPRRMRFAHHAVLAAAVAGDAQEFIYHALAGSAVTKEASILCVSRGSQRVGW
jgi:hypothetical protein